MPLSWRAGPVPDGWLTLAACYGHRADAAERGLMPPGCPFATDVRSQRRGRFNPAAVLVSRPAPAQAEPPPRTARARGCRPRSAPAALRQCIVTAAAVRCNHDAASA